VFFDEVQIIPDWNMACKSLRKENISLFITGSNSKLLSKEFTKELSGRYISFRIRPFVYKELQQYATQLNRKYSLADYLLYGGFPKILEFADVEVRVHYLNDLDEAIVMNDIMNRYKIRKEAFFRKLANYVLVSNGRIFSANSLQKYMQAEKVSCSLNTIMKYLSYLEEAYVICTLPQYSTKAKRQLKYYVKIYDEDVAFNTIRQINNRFDLTHNLENVVYNELIYRGYELYVLNKDGKEIDFLAIKNGKEYLIQVAYSVAEASTYDREFALFNTLDQARAKILITNDDVDFSTSTVRHIKLKDFLTMEDF
jgi:predicted AAA+ superfamily ATPase